MVSKLSVDKIKQRLPKHTILIESTYRTASEKAYFIDEVYGGWWKVAKYSSQYLESALKAAKSSNRHYKRIHWKTNQLLDCVGSYEAKTIDYLNFKKINFAWQPKVFTMPNGKTYRPDLFLIDQDKWIEIKGYMRDYSQLKWNWFLTIYPNSELWDKTKLKEMGIL